MNQPNEIPVSISLNKGLLAADLTLPDGTNSLIIFANGTGVSRLSPRNRFLAHTFNEAGFGTLVCDLMTPEEEAVDRYTRKFRFDIDWLGQRLVEITHWALDNPTTRSLELAYFSANTGAAAALLATTLLPGTVRAIVSRGGRPDLAVSVLEKVDVPTLFVVGAYDAEVLERNEFALRQLAAEDKKIETVAHATHLFEEPGTLAKVADLARAWFLSHLTPDAYHLRLQPKSDHLPQFS